MEAHQEFIIFREDDERSLRLLSEMQIRIYEKKFIELTGINGLGWMDAGKQAAEYAKGALHKFKEEFFQE